MIEIEQALAEIDAHKPRPVYLLVGEEYLVRRAGEAIVMRLVPKARASLNVSILEGAGPADVARDLTTVPMFRGTKVVVLREPEFFAPRKARAHAFAAVREAWTEGRRDAAARRLLALAARAGWGPDRLDPTADGAPSAADWKRELDVELADADVAFLKEVAQHCKARGLTAPESATTALEDVLARGLPAGHHLVVEASAIDTRSPLVRLCEKAGAIVDRKVERELKSLSISEPVADVLAPLGKRLEPMAEARLKDLCGGSMRRVRSEVEKLAAYVGERLAITVADVDELVLRAREGDWFELSNAFSHRDAAAAVACLDRALAQGDPPLMLLGSLASSVRRLLDERERCDRRPAPPGLPSFAEFKRSELPAVEKAAKAAGKKLPHPFAAYQLMQAALRYTRSELLRAHAQLAAADLALKSSANGRLVLEALAWSVCGTRPT